MSVEMTPSQALREILKLVQNKDNWNTLTHSHFNVGKIEQLANDGLKRPSTRKPRVKK